MLPFIFFFPLKNLCPVQIGFVFLFSLNFLGGLFGSRAFVFCQGSLGVLFSPRFVFAGYDRIALLRYFLGGFWDSFCFRAEGQGDLESTRLIFLGPDEFPWESHMYVPE